MSAGAEFYLKGDSNREGSVRLFERAESGDADLPNAALQLLRGGRWRDLELLPTGETASFTSSAATPEGIAAIVAALVAADAADVAPVVAASLPAALKATRPEIVYVTDFLTAPVKAAMIAGTTHDAATSLLAMQTALLAFEDAGPGRLWHFMLPSFRLQYTRNDWLRGFKNIFLDGYGCHLQCTSADAWFVNKNSLYGTQMMYHWPIGTLYPTGLQYYQGPKFASAIAGADQIECLTHADAAGFAVDDPIFLMGYDQQFEGWVPNNRYYEWNTVVSANASTGIITLAKGLINSYNQDWADVTLPAIYDFVAGGYVTFLSGKPRVLNLNRATSAQRLGTYWHARGIRFQGGLFNTQPQVFARTQVWTDCVSEKWTSGESEYTEWNGCRCDVIEVGKLIKRMLIKNTKAADRIGGAATDFCELDNVQCPEIQLSPKEMSVRNCTITDLMSPGVLHTQQRVLRLRDNIFRVGPAMVAAGSVLAHLEYWGKTKTFVAAASGAFITLDNGAVVAGGVRTAAQIVICEIGKGTHLSAEDGTWGGRVTEITFVPGEGTYGRFYIAGDWKSNPTGGATYSYIRCPEIIDEGGNTSAPNVPVFGTAMQSSPGTQYGLRRLRLSISDLYPVRGAGPLPSAYWRVYGWITRIEVVVTRPYNGAVATCSLRIRYDGALAGQVDLKTRGHRWITPGTHSTALGADNLVGGIAVTPLACVRLELAVLNTATGFGLSDASDYTKWPEAAIEVTYAPSAGALS